MLASPHYIRFSSAIEQSPEALSLSDGAFRLWIASMSWAQQQASEVIPSAWAKKIIPHRWKRLLRELEDMGCITILDPSSYKVEHEGHRWFLNRPVRRIVITPEVRKEVYDRDGWACVSCLREVLLTVDHIIPWSLGGSDDPSNLQTMCQPCNSRKGNLY